MRVLALVVGLSCLAAMASGQTSRRYPPEMPDAKVEVYKTVGDVKLNCYVIYPPGHAPSDQRAAIVFFFGGGWKSGSPAQFHEHARHFAARGMVAIAADYRVASRHDVKAAACVADAKSAVRWVRQNANRLGIDPAKVVAAGGSAGGHIAACAGVVPGLDEAGESPATSSVPNALVLFNPALVLAPIEGKYMIDDEKQSTTRERAGVDPRQISPYHHIRAGAPPTIIFHGREDTAVPYATAELFTQAMQAAGNSCRLVGYEGQQHGFFNFGREGNEHYQKTLAEADAFLVSLGFISAPPVRP